MAGKEDSETRCLVCMREGGKAHEFQLAMLEQNILWRLRTVAPTPHGTYNPSLPSLGAVTSKAKSHGETMKERQTSQQKHRTEAGVQELPVLSWIRREVH